MIFIICRIGDVATLYEQSYPGQDCTCFNTAEKYIVNPRRCKYHEAQILRDFTRVGRLLHAAPLPGKASSC